MGLWCVFRGVQGPWHAGSCVGCSPAGVCPASSFILVQPRDCPVVVALYSGRFCGVGCWITLSGIYQLCRSATGLFVVEVSFLCGCKGLNGRLC